MRVTMLMATIFLTMLCQNYAIAQRDTISIGFEGSIVPIITASSSQPGQQASNTSTSLGFLPNENAASRFLAHATCGYNTADIESVTTLGKEEWLETNMKLNKAFNLTDKVWDYYQFIADSIFVNNFKITSRAYRYALWNYFMQSPDEVRQRVALALSEILVVSDVSNFSNNGFALANYYDILLDHALENYKDLLRAVTYSPVMGVYLTFLNNPKTNTSTNTFPDENYAREIMQLFTIGTELLNNDGTLILDTNGSPIPTYDNNDILEYSKVFTGLSWGDRTVFNRGAYNDTSYITPLQMFNDHHEPGQKFLLNGVVVPDRVPVDGDADIEDAISSLFNHPNTPPFVCKLLIQRLVTSNPTPAYVARVSNVFIDNGNGVRGDLRQVVKAILLDEEANQCYKMNDPHFGKLSEPFLRYVQLNKALEVSTLSGEYRNDLDYVYRFTGQRPLSSPTVFNFFQSDFQPLGEIENANLVGPEFQITNALSITGYYNGLDRWIIDENIADEYDIFNGEANSGYDDEISNLDFLTETMYTDDDKLHILFDRLNLLLAHGSVSQEAIDTFIEVIKQFPNNTQAEKVLRVKLSIYLLTTTPEYLVKK